MRWSHLAILALLLLPAAACLAQGAAPDAIASWTFDADTEGWQLFDPTGDLTTTDDPKIARENGGGALQYGYTAKEAQITAVLVPTEAGLAGAKSLHYWIRTSEYAMVMNMIIERDESRYVAQFTSIPGRWQEVWLDLSEFRLEGDSTDENGQLDADQIATVGFADATGFLAGAAKTVTFLVAPDLGPRQLWLDDFSVTTKSIQPRWQEITVAGRPAVRVESFERAPLEWFVLAGKGVEAEYDAQFKADGDFSLRLQYDLPAGKVFGAMTPLSGVPLQGAKSLSLAVMSETATTLLIELKESDESKYQTTVPVQAGDKFQIINLSLDQFRLDDNSKDENGRLDPEQIKEMTVADISVMTGNPVSTNTLWLDDFVFGK